MVRLPVHSDDRPTAGCGKHCGEGMEKIYPTTAVRYGAMNWIGEFTYKPGMVFRCRAKVVIQTDRGIELGEQVSLSCGGCDKSISREQIKRYVEASGPEFYRFGAGRILREARPDDLIEHERLNAHNREDIERCQLMAAQLGLDMKVVTVEHLLGGERIVFYFRADGRVDFRELVRNLARHYHTRIEMRQVGARDEARLVADYEICGRECCCKNFLKKLRPVTMKMAKLQKSTLDPSKVSGRCGRLRCCLRYEHEGYEQLAAKLPRIGSYVRTEFGLGRVIDRQILTQLVLIRTDDGREITVPNEEIQARDLPAPNKPIPARRGSPVLADDNGNGEPARPQRPRRPQRGQPPRESAAAPDTPPPAAPSSDAGDNAGSSGPSRPGRRRRRGGRRRRGRRGPQPGQDSNG